MQQLMMIFLSVCQQVQVNDVGIDLSVSVDPGTALCWLQLFP